MLALVNSPKHSNHWGHLLGFTTRRRLKSEYDPVVSSYYYPIILIKFLFFVSAAGVLVITLEGEYIRSTGQLHLPLLCFIYTGIVYSVLIYLNVAQNSEVASCNNVSVTVCLDRVT